MNKFIYTSFLLILFFSCTTIKESPYKESNNIEEETKNKETNIISNNEITKAEKEIIIIDSNIKKLSESILQSIKNKDWNSIIKISDRKLYKNYIEDTPLKDIDFCMFILHTAEKGIGTNYSLNEISDAYYTSYSNNSNIHTFEGYFVYPTKEVEYFKYTLTKIDNEYTIIRD